MIIFDLSRFTYSRGEIKQHVYYFLKVAEESGSEAADCIMKTLETKRNVRNNRSVQSLYSFFSVVDPQGLIFKVPLSDVWSRGNHTFCQSQSRSQAVTGDGR